MTHTITAHINNTEQYHHMWDGAGAGMWLWPLLWLALFGLLAFMLMKWSQTGDKHTKKSAADIVKERYAKGEIDKKEYSQLLKDLKD